MVTGKLRNCKVRVFISCISGDVFYFRVIFSLLLFLRTVILIVTFANKDYLISKFALCILVSFILTKKGKGKDFETGSCLHLISCDSQVSYSA